MHDTDSDRVLTGQLVSQAPTTAPDSAATPTSAETSYPFRFTGSGKEYFRVWIVNLLLSIITLGIYSAWAKVRKKRYFYGNTWVGESNFEFHGNPVSILKGRIIAVAALAAYSGVGYLSPNLGQVLFMVLVIAAPWFIARTFAFNAHYSSYRGIRFKCRPTTKEVFVAVWPFLLVSLTALLFSPTIEEGRPPKLTGLEWMGMLAPAFVAMFAYPYVFGTIKQLQIGRAAYGKTPFRFSAGIRAFYKMYFKSYVILFLVLLCFVFFTGIVMFIPVINVFLLPLGYMVAGAAYLGYLRSRVGNLTLSSTTLGESISFRSTLSSIELAKLYFVNLVAITVSLGLLVPWAAVRVARYRAAQLTLYSRQDLDSFVSDVGSAVGATGEEVGEFFDLDLSL